MFVWFLLLLPLLELIVVSVHSQEALGCPPPVCTDRPSVIYIPGGSGYEDRHYTFELFATFANFLCESSVVTCFVMISCSHFSSSIVCAMNYITGARVYVRPPWSVLQPFIHRGIFINKSLGWTDFFAHDKSYCGDENLPRSLNYSGQDYMYNPKKHKSYIIDNPIPIKKVVDVIKQSGFHGHFDVLLDDNVKNYLFNRTIHKNFKRALEISKSGKTFLWSIHKLFHHYCRAELADMFEEAVYNSGTHVVGDYTARYVLPKNTRDVAAAFLRNHSLVKNKFIVMHFRRAKDAIQTYGCKRATPQDAAKLISRFTTNCARLFPPGYTVAFHTDVHDPIFLKEIASEIRNLGYIPLHIDPSLTLFIDHLISIGELDIKYRNNHLLYVTIQSIRLHHSWLLDIHRPQKEDLSGSCEKGSWDPITCLRVPMLSYAERSFDVQWLGLEAHVPVNRSTASHTPRLGESKIAID